MDRHFDDKGFNDSGLTMRPSDIFRRNCWISFEPVEGSISALADYIGPEQDPVGDRLSAPRRLLPRRARHAARADEGPVGRDAASDHGRRRHGVLRPALIDRGQRIVIAGGGAIGVSIAYFLSRRGAEPIVIERHEVAGSASGKSGGFLAMDWCRGTALDRLARRSFALHAELADTLGNPWGHRRLETFAGWAAENETARGAKRRHGFPTGSRSRPARLAANHGLVEPRGFTTGLMRAAEAQGPSCGAARSWI